MSSTSHRAPFAATSEANYLVRIRDLELERDKQVLLLRINNLLANLLEPEKLFEAISSAIWQEIRHSFLAIATLEADGSLERLRLLNRPTKQETLGDIQGMLEISRPPSEALKANRLELFGPEQVAAAEPPLLRRTLQQKGIRSMCCIPLISRGKVLGSLNLGHQSESAFSQANIELLQQVSPQIAIALDNALAYQEIRMLRDRLAEEKLYLEEEVRRDFDTGEVIGHSPALIRVLQQVETVAPSDATVLLMGETGTGKELVARAIHERSRRRERTFVKLNCSAIPMGLMESELFGHEKGAFTGAIHQKVGRFELAHQGSIFLDEVGDLPLELQPKLLRAIQEREFERLGSNKTIHVDVRMIAATHRDLPRMVQAGEFRSDLFYRLNVFPIHVPPLRERREDIPSLVRYFAQKFAKAMDRRIERIPSSTMDALVAWQWPGNIRELQNLVERSVILSQGPELRVPLGELRASPNLPYGGQTLEEVERREIRQALKACGGIVGGPRGAATRLGLKRTTLNSRMRKLGIRRLQGD